MKRKQLYKSNLWTGLKSPLQLVRHYWRGSWWHKTVTIIVSIIIILLLGMYGIGRWYVWSERHTPLTMGVSFIPDYASYLGVDPQQTMDALINDLHVKQFRLVSYWSDIEPTKGHYDFSQLDWEFAKANAAHAKIALSVGLRQPRWPECHAPAWVDTAQPEEAWYPQLKSFMTAVVNHYKTNPALQSYQLENEYFLTTFGKCHNFSRNRLINEAKLVKQLDSFHTLIISRSNNALGVPIGQPTPDAFGVSIYRRVWDQYVTYRYFEYPFPSWFYAFLAGSDKIVSGKDTIIHELQAEPWAPYGAPATQTSLSEQSKSFNAKILKQNIDFAKATGMKIIDLWGAEYWYYRLEKLHDPSVWNTAKQEFNQ